MLRLHVHPGAGRSSVVGRHGDALKVRVAAPPERNQANEACVSLVAGTFGVAEDRVEIVGGSSSRAKRVRIRDADVDEVRRLLTELVAAPVAPGNNRGGRGLR